MGVAVSAPAVSPPSGKDLHAHHLGRALGGTEKTQFETFWSQIAGEDDRMTAQAFIRSDVLSEYSEELKAAAFRYLSLNNDTLEKEFLENRIISLIRRTPHRDTSFVVAPWVTLIDVVEVTPSQVIGIASRNQEAVPTEAKSVQEILVQVPDIENIFNQSVASMVLQPNTEGPTIPLSTNNSILTPNAWNIVNLLISESPEPQLLFCSQSNGFSFRALSPAIKYYPGKLLFVFKSSVSLFGFYCNRQEWTETTNAFDEAARDTVLFQLTPELRVRRINKLGRSNCIYFNSSNGNYPVGIGLGGRLDSFRLWLDGADISKVTSMSSDATYEPGQLISGHDESTTLTVSAIQIFGLSGPGAIAQQQDRRAAQSELKQDRKRVDRAKLVQNEFDKEMFFNKTFGQSGAAAQERLGNA